MAGETPSEGSSKNMSRGFDISAMPTLRIRCSPPLNVPASWDSRSLSRGNSSWTWSRRLLRSPRDASMSAPRRRLAATVRSGNTKRSDGVYDIPSRTCLAQEVPVMSCPW